LYHWGLLTFFGGFKDLNGNRQIHRAEEYEAKAKVVMNVNILPIADIINWRAGLMIFANF
jgi:hypothetical protein